MLAVALGAEILEKHFTPSRNLPGKDQAMLTEISEFEELVKWAKQIDMMKGDEKVDLSRQ
jgi:sialic acid synthase SpsE|tara:strand:+ start:291 stop:470 length:180 start_codon:yes stop_codon:yes gene_type:complete